MTKARSEFNLYLHLRKSYGQGFDPDSICYGFKFSVDSDSMIFCSRYSEDFPEFTLKLVKLEV